MKDEDKLRKPYKKKIQNTKYIKKYFLKYINLIHTAEPASIRVVPKHVKNTSFPTKYLPTDSLFRFSISNK